MMKHSIKPDLNYANNEKLTRKNNNIYGETTGDKKSVCRDTYETRERKLPSDSYSATGRLKEGRDTIY